MGLKIKLIIFSNDTCIVFMDEKDVIQWTCDEEYQKDTEFGLIINKMSYWESLCNKLFEKNLCYENKCLLAEGVSRVFIDRTTTDRFQVANEILDTTIHKIKIEGENILRNAYVKSSIFSFVALVILLVVEECCKRVIVSNLGYDWHSLCQTAMVTGVGSFVSAITRAKDFKPDIIVDKKIHILDGVLRIVLGVLTGVFVWLGIKSNLIFSFLNNARKGEYIILFLGMTSGISERILPSIIKQFEKKIDSNIPPTEEQKVSPSETQEPKYGSYLP